MAVISASFPTILIVDDEVKNRKLLKLLLEHEGYLTLDAASGDEALATIEQQAPDLILLDVMMPTLDGYQVARILKAHPASLNIPIIMISAHGDRTARLAGLNAGAEEFLTKPIDRDELWLRVRNLLRLKADADVIRDNSVLLEQRVQARTMDLQRFSIAMDATADALTLTDRRSMRFIEVNAAACKLLGYTREEMLSMGPSQVVQEDDLELRFEAIIAGDGPSQPSEMAWRRKDGSEVGVEVNRQAVQTGDDWTIVSVARDITERKQTEARLRQLAHYDALTGLPNRRLFQDSLAKAMEQADALDMQVVLLYLDLDDFKDVNDSFGHSIGDELLRGIGQRLLATLYPRDIAGRLGGDEFGIILLTPHDTEIAMIVAGRVHAALSSPFALTGHTVRTSVSIGITVYPSDTDNAEVLSRYADMAMYEAKRSGRNTSRFYTAEMNQRVDEKSQLVTALREALVCNEFVLHYQPKVSLDTGHWTGVEALLRWQRPGHGLVPPDKFIPVLEESGLIVPVGAWVIGEACRQLADWRHRDLQPLPIAVNVSALQIAHKHVARTSVGSAATADGGHENIELLSAVAARLQNHAVPVGLLEIEITESVVMADAGHSIEILQRLREMGVTLSVDDFGTGYSSLSYLRRFPLESVKIDGSFIRDVTTSAEDASIAVAIIEMAHRMKLKVIAECVETAEQMQFLQAHECDQAQGYYFAKPMPADELEALWSKIGGGFGHLVASPVDLHADEIFACAWPECTAFVAALLAGSREDSIAIVERRLADGHGLLEVDRQLIQPALYRIGEKWRSREVSVAQEHLATALALSVMAQGVCSSPAPARNGRKVLLACLRDNHHAVGLQMVADAFSLAGWDVSFLGTNVPGDALVKHAMQMKPDLVALSASLPEHVRELRLAIDQLREAFAGTCPPILVGGQGFNASKLAADDWDGVILVSDPAAAVVAGDLACTRATRAPALASMAAACTGGIHTAETCSGGSGFSCENSKISSGKF
jgi:diguanylate cyclase (GGDEF)-like protein/PAS domain S-box-containing protein